MSNVVTQDKLNRLAADLFGYGRGLPAGTLDPVDIQEETIVAELKELVKAAHVLGWAIRGGVALLMARGWTGPNLFYNFSRQGEVAFPWNSAASLVSMFPKILASGIDINPTISADIYYEVFFRGRDLEDSEAAGLWAAAVAGRWPVMKINQAVYLLRKYKRGLVQGSVSILEGIRIAGERREAVRDLTTSDSSPEEAQVEGN